MLKTLDNSLNILKYFTKNKSSWGVRELAKAANMNHTVVYRILAVFEQHGFLSKNNATLKYSFGFKMLEYGSILREHLKIDTIIKPIMEQLVEKTGETVLLATHNGEHGLFIEIVDSKKPIKLVHSIGVLSELYLGATNKVMMANLSLENQEKLMEPILYDVSGNIIDKAKLREELETIKKNGWAYTSDEVTEGSFGLSMPLFNARKQVIAAISVVGLKQKNPKRNIEVFRNMLADHCNLIQDFILKHQIDEF